PWCAPVSVKLGFLDEQGRDAVRLELRSPTRTCTNNELDESVGLYRERGLSIEFYGSTIRIPSSCLKGLSFRLGDLSLAIGERGVGIKITGRSVDHGTKVRTVIYTVDAEVLCSQSTD